MLDFTLSCCDMGRSDSLRIQEPLEDENESRESSVLAIPDPASLCFTEGRRHVDGLGGVVCVCVDRRCEFRERMIALGASWAVDCCVSTVDSTHAEPVVPGREGNVGDMGDINSRSGVFRFPEVCLEGGIVWFSAGWPKTRPVAAAAMAVPDPMSCTMEILELAIHPNWIGERRGKTVGSTMLEESI